MCLHYLSRTTIPIKDIQTQNYRFLARMVESLILGCEVLFSYGNPVTFK